MIPQHNAPVSNQAFFRPALFCRAATSHMQLFSTCRMHEAIKIALKQQNTNCLSAHSKPTAAASESQLLRQVTPVNSLLHHVGLWLCHCFGCLTGLSRTSVDGLISPGTMSCNKVPRALCLQSFFSFCCRSARELTMTS